MKDLPVTYTLHECATIWRVHYNTVRQWVSEGKLIAIEMPGSVGSSQPKYRVTQEEIDRHLRPKPQQ